MSKLDEIKSMREAGFSQRDIASKMDLSRSGVRHYLSKLNLQESALVLNDLHIPFEDQKAVELTLKVGTKLDPEWIFLNGDLGDYFELSKYHKQSKWRDKAKINHELSQSRDFLKNLRGLFPDSRILYIGGNHEYRWDVYIDSHAREIVGLQGLSLQEQLNLDQFNIEWIYSGLKESSYQWGKILIGHFDRVSKHSCFTCKHLVDDKGFSLLQAHTHRGGSFYKRVFDKTLVGFENFCLCRLDPPYVDRPNWQLGFSIIYKDRNSDLFQVCQHPIVAKGNRYRTFFRGQVVEV